MKDKLYTERTIKTYAGHYIDVFDPNPDHICIEDIAHALSHTPRWGGHTVEFYSVAQHSLWVCENLPNKYKLEGLLHDATEAYIGDMPNFNRIEDNLDKAIRKKFGLPQAMSPVVKEFDKKALEWEWVNVKELTQQHFFNAETNKRFFLEQFNRINT